jgi:hypothetical protein
MIEVRREKEKKEKLVDYVNDPIPGSNHLIW